MRSFKIKVPSFFDIVKKSAKNGLQRHHLSYNTWVGKHFIVKNNIKQGYKDIILKLLEEKKLKEKGYKFRKIKISYEVYFKSKTGDLMNLVSIIDKMALDAIVSYGIIEDDTHVIVPLYDRIEFINYDKEKNGYMIMYIEELPYTIQDNILPFKKKDLKIN